MNELDFHNVSPLPALKSAMKLGVALTILALLLLAPDFFSAVASTGWKAGTCDVLLTKGFLYDKVC